MDFSVQYNSEKRQEWLYYMILDYEMEYYTNGGVTKFKKRFFTQE